MADLPEGFVLDSPQKPDLPPGFVLDSQAQSPKLEPQGVGFKPAMAAPFEAIGQLATGAIAEVGGGLGGLLSLLIPGAPPAGDVVKNIRSNMTYEPRTSEGKHMVPNLVESVINATPEIIKKPIAATGQAYSHLENWVADNYGPAAGAAVATLPTALLEAIPAGLAMKKIRDAGRAAPAIKTMEEASQAAQSGPILPDTVTPTIPMEEQQQAIQSAIKSGKPEKIAPEVKPDAQILKDAEELGIDLNPSHYSTNRAYIEMEQALKSRPGSQLGTVENQAIINLGNKADDLIEKLGGSTDKSLLDANIKSEFDSTISGLDKQSNMLYDSVEAAIPKSTKIKANYTREFIANQLKDLGGNESLLTSAEKKLQDLIETRPTYAAIDRVRKDIGSAIGKRSGPFKDDDVGQLKQLYAVLSQDQEGVAKAFGVGDDFADAKKLVAKRKDIEDKAVSLLGSNLSNSLIPKLKQSAAGLTKGDVSAFQKLMESVPESRRQEVAANLLNDLFTSGQRRNAPIGQGFVNAYEGLLRNKGAKDALFAHLPQGAEERFNMIGRVAKGIYNAKALENTSGTARAILNNIDDSVLSKLYGIGKQIAAAEGVSTAIGIPGAGTAGVVGSVLSKGATSAAKKADELLTSSQFREAMKTAAKKNAPEAKKLELTPQYKAWLAAQNPKIQKQVVAMGFIPWLTSEDK